MNAPLDPETDSSSAPPEKVMGFWEHLDELRGTIIKSVAAFLVCAGLVGYFTTEFKRIAMWPFDKVVAQYPDFDITLGTTSPMEGLNLIVESCMFGGLTLAAPFILFFVAQFIAPALTQRETKVVLPMCLAACALFLFGAVFAFFFLMPSAMQVFIEINVTLELAFRWSIGSYYTIFTRTVFGVGAAFEFPLLIVVLVWLGILNTAFLRKYRRHAIIVIFTVAALVTPSWDPLIQTLCAAPLYLLYEASIWVSARVEKHRERSGAAVLLALLALHARSKPSGTPAFARA